MIYSYFSNKFFSRLRDFDDEYVKISFEYFLNVSIPLSEKFYTSGYIQEQTKVADLEGALINTFGLGKSIPTEILGKSSGIFSSIFKHTSNALMMLIAFIIVVGFLFGLYW